MIERVGYAYPTSEMAHRLQHRDTGTWYYTEDGTDWPVSTCYEALKVVVNSPATPNAVASAIYWGAEKLTGEERSMLWAAAKSECVT